MATNSESQLHIRASLAVLPISIDSDSSRVYSMKVDISTISGLPKFAENTNEITHAIRSKLYRHVESLHKGHISTYPMLVADSRFWLANNCEVHAHLTFDVISLIYKEKRMLLMTSQWWSRPPSSFLAAAMRPSNTVFTQLFRPDKSDIW